VVHLFERWVREADQKDNGVISLNRQRQRYSATTVDRAVKWLKAHRLLFLVEQGGGRGNGNRYFVRWSFLYETLSARQNAVNHPKTAKTLHFDIYAREEVLKLLDEELKRNKRSLLCKTSCQNVSLSKSTETDILATENRQKRQLRNERSVRWSMSQIRAITTDENVLAAAARAVRGALNRGQVWIGSELAKFVEQVISWVRDHEEGGWEEGRQRTFSYIGAAAQEACSFVRWDRYNLAERLEREQEREEARRDPLPVGFSCRTFNGVAKATPPVMKRAISERSHKRDEHPATVYASDPVNVCEMMSGYLGKLRGGVDEMERNDRN